MSKIKRLQSSNRPPRVEVMMWEAGATLVITLLVSTCW